ncbi:ATP-dependent DNA helicase RecG [Frateuria aurantia]
MRERSPLNGDSPVTSLAGVGPALAEQLARMGLSRIQDLWFHLPLRYEDRTRITAVAGLLAGSRAQLLATVVSVETGYRFRRQLKVVVSDGSGELTLRFFHFHKGQVAQLQEGVQLLCYGDVRSTLGGLEMVHPQYTRVEAGTEPELAQQLDPVYPVTEGLGPKRMATLVAQALQWLPAPEQLELVPSELVPEVAPPTMREALLYVHRPPPDADLRSLSQGGHPCQRRLVFEELLAQHLALRSLRRTIRIHTAPKFEFGGDLQARFLARLPFQLTAAQTRVGAEIEQDLRRDKPMLRLVQGDVGCGKTVVAALAALAAVQAGYQVALMAPTELLAEQHLRNFTQWLEPLGVEVVWLAGRVKGRARVAALAKLAQGAAIAIGTHALMQEGVSFERLGLVIVDEQHRFGVQQRLDLSNKGRHGDQVPHQLVLTATPIPRTLAMSAYADLDVSSIDELPPGRTPVKTVALSDARRDEVVDRVDLACAQGRQAYWVCTLIEENEQMRAQAAEVVHADLTAMLSRHKVGLVHGRLRPSEKQAVMDAFKAGELAVLVATTVIEVGVDVPNASLMIIENSERLGLAQLHQLRGRVGRGAQVSNCVLLYQPPLGAMARERLHVMRDTNDGFVIAEKDLQLRGPGEVLGTRQTGQLSFRIADLARDADLLPLVQEAADTLLVRHPRQAERLMRRWIGSAERFAQA